LEGISKTPQKPLQRLDARTLLALNMKRLRAERGWSQTEPSSPMSSVCAKYLARQHREDRQGIRCASARVACAQWPEMKGAPV
jgi:hypothetical protein